MLSVVKLAICKGAQNAASISKMFRTYPECSKEAWTGIGCGITAVEWVPEILHVPTGAEKGEL